MVPFLKEDEFHFACSCREAADSVDKMLLRGECSAQSCTEPVKEMRPGKKGELTLFQSVRAAQCDGSNRVAVPHLGQEAGGDP